MKSKINKMSYKVKDSRYILGKNIGESILELFIEEYGWCRFSWETGAIYINGQWIIEWENLDPE